MLDVKNTIPEMKTTFDELIRRLPTAKERISELDNTTVELKGREKNTE